MRPIEINHHPRDERSRGVLADSYVAILLALTAMFLVPA